ncbi:DUF6678 family protein [Hymenobacter norwichensis]|uniref:DUF6678 family protein n=1 Tax=Hymenobacter norwichensis TaxID=223903 RepID=UPI0003B62F62|nr:DUF6678 family protein [Hymenobacter norwichensis]
MNGLVALQNLVYNTHCKVRLKVCREGDITDWGNMFGLPVEGYIEVSGPERISDVEWIELDPIVVTLIGRLVPPKVEVVTDEIIQTLNNTGIKHDVVEGMIRIDGRQLG